LDDLGLTSLDDLGQTFLRTYATPFSYKSSLHSTEKQVLSPISADFSLKTRFSASVVRMICGEGEGREVGMNMKTMIFGACCTYDLCVFKSY
jgi:hypothetical protein